MTKEKAVKHSRIGLKILILIGLIAVICCAMLISMDIDIVDFSWNEINPRELIQKLQEEYTQKKYGVFSLGEIDVSQTAAFGENLLVLTNYDIRLLDPGGDEVWYFTHELRHPVLNVNGDWILVYEKNGKSYMLIKDGKIVKEDMLDEEIAFGQAADKYILFVAVNNNGYKRTIKFIAPETGISLGALYLDDYYPYYAKIFNDDRYFLLYGLGMNSTNISTIIQIYDNSKETTPIANIQVDGLYPVMYSNSSNYMFAGEDKVYLYDNNLDLIWFGDFQDNIAAAGLFENNYAVVAFNGDKKVIRFYNSSGEETKNVETENSVQNIVVCGNTAAVISGSKVLFFNSSGKLIDTVSMAGISLSVHFVNSGQAFLVTEHEAVLHNIAK